MKMPTLIGKEPFWGQPPFGKEHPVHHRLSATGLFSTTTSVGSINVLGGAESTRPHIIPSALEHETTQLASEKIHFWLEDLHLPRVEELAKAADIVRFAAEAYAPRMQEAGWIADISRSVLKEQQAHFRALGRVAESVAGLRPILIPEVVLGTVVAQSVQEQVARLREQSHQVTEIAQSILRQTYQGEVRETISPQAVEYTKSLGAYGSLVMAKKLVWETFPNLRRLTVSREEDPEEGGHPVTRFTITTSEPVERVLDLNDELLDAFCRDIPARHQSYFAFTFEPEE